MKNMRALSIRQPYAELILRGIKKIEYRKMVTHIRGRIFIYASLTPGYIDDWEDIHMKPGDLPTGVLVGTVEITDCTGEPGDYQWHLAKPERLERNMKPQKHPQPAWFNPF